MTRSQHALQVSFALALGLALPSCGGNAPPASETPIGTVASQASVAVRSGRATPLLVPPEPPPPPAECIGVEIGPGLQNHSDAQALRSRCTADHDQALCALAEGKYRLAAATYRSYLECWPNGLQAYEFHYNRADALFWSGDPEGAAQESVVVRDSSVSDIHLADSAIRVVASVQRLLDAAQANHQLSMRTDPPAPSGTPLAVTPIVVPELVQRLTQAREVYLARVDAAADREHLRDVYELENALLLYAYGYWSLAQERLTRIFTEHCSGPNASESGRRAWSALRRMAADLGQTEEVNRLSAHLQARRCTFESGVVVTPTTPSR